MHILFFSHYFPPEIGAPPARLFEVATRMRDKGHDITVITAMPNRPTGQIFKGYRGRLRMIENLQGIKVIRTWLWPTKSAKFFQRMRCDCSFICTSTLLGSWGLGRQDILIYQSPPLVSALSGYAISRLTGAKTIMWNGDIWPDILINSGQLRHGFAADAMFWLQRFGCNNADVVAVTNPGAEQQILKRYPHIRTIIWSNGVDVNLFRPELQSDEIRKSLGAESGDFLVGYIGLHGRFQGLDVLLGAAERLKDKPRIKFFMIGEGVEKQRLITLAKGKKIRNIIFYDSRPKKEIPPILASCDVSLVPLICRMPFTMPSKAYEALAAGVPIVVSKGCQAEALVDT
jgi:glycosyltransferase involved in cell wall biosynthesis